MTAPVNCYTIRAGAPYNAEGVPVADGVTFTYDDDNRSVFALPSTTVSISDRPGYAPELDRESQLLKRARLNSLGWLVQPEPGYGGAFVHIVSKDLTFQNPQYEDMRLWVGGDGDILPFRFYGKQNDPDREQLFLLGNGQRIFVISENEGVRWMTCVDGRLEFSQPEEAEVIDFLLRRALAKESRRAFEWAIYNLQSLCRQGLSTPDQRAAEAGIVKLNSHMPA